MDNSSENGRRIIGSYYCTNVSKVKPEFLKMTFFFKNKLAFRKSTLNGLSVSSAGKDAFKNKFSPKLSGTDSLTS